jgi:hypothetical protein
MRSIALVALVLSAFLFSPDALACGGSSPEVTTPASDAGRFYVDNEVCQPGCVVAVAVYQESNGRAGLQRGDARVDDTCGGQFLPDTMITLVSFSA